MHYIVSFLQCLDNMFNLISNDDYLLLRTDIFSCVLVETPLLCQESVFRSLMYTDRVGLLRVSSKSR